MGLGSTNVLYQRLMKEKQGRIPKKVEMAAKEKDEKVFNKGVGPKCHE